MFAPKACFGLPREELKTVGECKFGRHVYFLLVCSSKADSFLALCCYITRSGVHVHSTQVNFLIFRTTLIEVSLDARSS